MLKISVPALIDIIAYLLCNTAVTATVRLLLFCCPQGMCHQQCAVRFCILKSHKTVPLCVDQVPSNLKLRGICFILLYVFKAYKNQPPNLASILSTMSTSL